jgi:predicted RNA-binding protein YlxR (DUF448 family)/ribosomal protein L30E
LVACGTDEDETGPLRRCIATGAVRPKDELLRFVVAPDGRIVPDVAGRLPGRGLWLAAHRDIVAAAVAKRLFGRAARASVTVPGDLADQVEELLRRRCCDLIGLARRAGQAVAGFEKVRSALREGKVAVLIAASDGGESGRDKVRAAGPGLPVVEALTAEELGAAFGREHVVHAALAPGRLARELIGGAARLAGYLRPSGILDIGRNRRDRRGRADELDGSGTT